MSRRWTLNICSGKWKTVRKWHRNGPKPEYPTGAPVEDRFPALACLTAFPATLPGLAAGGSSAKTPDPPPAVPKQGKKHSHADDDEITEIPVEDEPVEPPKKKKKKKDKGRSKEEVPDPVIPDDGVCPGTSSAKPEEAVKPKPATGPSGDPDEGGRTTQKEEKEEETEETEGTEGRSRPREVPGTGTRSQSQGDG